MGPRERVSLSAGGKRFRQAGGQGALAREPSKRPLRSVTRVELRSLAGPGATLVHRPAALHMLLDEAPHVISNAIIGVFGAHTTSAMRRRVMRNYDNPVSRQPFPLQEVS